MSVVLSKRFAENNKKCAVCRTSVLNNITPLIEASQKGQTDTVKILLEKGTDLNAKNINNWTALMFATEKGHTDIVKMLLEKGTDVNAKDDNGYTALIIASYNKHTEIVRMLLENGADVNMKDKYNHTALMFAIKHINHLEDSWERYWFDTSGIVSMLLRREQMLMRRMIGAGRLS